MNEEQRRHALALNEAHMLFGSPEEDTHRERIARAMYVQRRDGSRPAKPGSLEAMALDQIRRRSE